MSDDFGRVTAVQKSADGRYEGCIAEGWDIGGVPNGGYVLAIAGRAMAESVGRPPLSITAHYLAPTRPGPCAIAVEPVRVGGRMATLTASVAQDGRESFRVLGTFGEGSGADPILIDGKPPELPAYDDCAAAPPSTPTAATAGP
ncbi:MAG: thioesterase family protein, partial [Actinomycetota bacterium]|nr:thioesterase family protein [Actinomycetota bacterium]